MKRMFALILALTMVFAMAATAFAAETGTITINGASDGNVYEIYKLLDLESYNTTSGAYSYKVNTAWQGFFATAEAKVYMAVDDSQYATWVGPETDEAYAAFAKLALAYAEKEHIAPLKSTKNSGDYETITGGIVFKDLELGYYLIDSTMGALCGLTTTNPNAAINAKNAAPTISKQVKEDSSGNFGSSDTADIGQVIEFRTTINVHAGAQNYVLHDKMSAGLTFLEVTGIKHQVPPADPHDTDHTKYTVVTEGLTDGCTFHVVFEQEFCDSLNNNDKIFVYYTAKLNENAVIAGEGNTNEAKLEFGEEHETTSSQTVTKTFAFDLVKTDSQGKPIDGAHFYIYNAQTGGEIVAVVKVSDGVYRRAADVDPADLTKHDEIVVTGGQVRLIGFDSGTYYLEETVAPQGFNKLNERKGFIIGDKNLDASFDIDGKISAGSGVQVVNKTGNMLPETGAMGTLMFITFGMCVALLTGVLLITKKRVSMIED